MRSKTLAMQAFAAALVCAKPTEQSDRKDEFTTPGINTDEMMESLSLTLRPAIHYNWEEEQIFYSYRVDSYNEEML